MYVTPTFTGLTQPVYVPSQIQQNFQFTVQTPDHELTQLTPSVAMAAASTFIQKLSRNTLMRTGAYNVVAQNAFVNDHFRSFVTQCMRAAYVAMEQNQTTSINDVNSRLMAEWVDMFTAAVTMQNPSTLSTLDQATADSVRQLAARYMQWLRDTEIALATIYDKKMRENKFNYPVNGEYFGAPVGSTTNHYNNHRANALSGPTGLSVLDQPGSSSPLDGGAQAVGEMGYFARKAHEERERAERKRQEEMQNAARNHNVGGFNEAGTSVMLDVEYVSPFTTKLRKEQVNRPVSTSRWGTPADMTTAVAAPPAPPPMPMTPPPPPPVGSRATDFTPNMTPVSTHSAVADIEERALVADAKSTSAADFDEAIMDFTQSPVKVVAPTPETHMEKKPIIKSTTMNGHTLNIVSLLTDVSVEASGWKPSRFQYYYPCYCARTHCVIYAIADGGEVVAIVAPLDPEEIEEMFSYEAHAINPGKGKPDALITTPIREEAKVLYKADSTDVQVVVDTPIKIGSTQADLLQQIQIEARTTFNKDKKAQAVSVVGQAYEYMGYESAEEMKEQYDALREVRLKVTYDSCAKAISAIKSPNLRKQIDALFTTRFNSLLRDRLGIGGSVKSFCEEAAAAPELVRDRLGDVVADALIEIQSEFIAETLDVSQAEEVPAIASFRSGLSDEEDIKQYMATTMFLQTNHLVVISRFTDDELAISCGKGTCQLDADAYPALHSAIRQSLEAKNVEGIRFESITLQSIDGSKYGVWRSPLNADILLLKPL